MALLITATGPTVERSYVFPDADATILTTNSAVTVAQGGTGLATLTAHALYVGAGTSALAAVAVGATGQVLVGATGADPAWSATPTVTSLVFSSYVSVGTTPATAGVIRLASGDTIQSRNNANDANYPLIGLISDRVSIASGGQATIVGSTLIMTDNTYMVWDTTGSFRFLTDGKFSLMIRAANQGVCLDASNAALMKLRDYNDGAYATFDALAYKVSGTAGIDASITTGSLVGKTITVSKGIITGFA